MAEDVHLWCQAINYRHDIIMKELIQLFEKGVYMDQQLELFEENPSEFLEYDADDPEPKVGYADLHWFIANRLAEESIRFMRLLGLL